MPVPIDGKTYDNHDAAVRAVKANKPNIKNPDAYVATIERSIKGGRIQTLDEVKKGISGYLPSHPFDSLSPEDKLSTLRQAIGINYVPPVVSPKYDDLPLLARQGVDRIFKTEKIAIV